MKMNTQIFEARQNRMDVEQAISARLNALYQRRNQLFSLPPDERDENPHDVIEQIKALAASGVRNMMEFASADSSLVTERDLEWICRKMLTFVRKGGWEMLGDVEQAMKVSWQKRGQMPPSALASALVQVKTARNAYEASKRPSIIPQNTMHPGGRPNKLSRKEIDARRAANRQVRLEAQSPKGKSTQPPNGHANPGAKKEKKGK